jgi:hypothetical protein
MSKNTIFNNSESKNPNFNARPHVFSQFGTAEDSIEEKTGSCIVNLNDGEPPIAPAILLLIENEKKIPIASLSNISVIIGKAKSRKTFALSLFLGTLLAEKAIQCIASDRPGPEKYKVLLFDTEQAVHKVFRVGKRVQSLSNNYCDLYFKIYGLRSKSVQERIEIIQHAIYSQNDVLFVAIDGIRDLVFDFNDPKESSTIVGMLMKWSEERNIHIMTVLHQNKGDNNARGHLGTELINKAETVISVTKNTKNPAVSIVAAEYCREEEFSPFALGVNQEALPYVAEDWSPSDKDNQKKMNTPFDYPVKTHEMILDGTFYEAGQQLKYSSLVQQVKTSLQAFLGEVGDNRARDFVAYFLKMGWIKKEGKDKSPTAYYYRA